MVKIIQGQFEYQLYSWLYGIGQITSTLLNFLSSILGIMLMHEVTEN